MRKEQIEMAGYTFSETLLASNPNERVEAMNGFVKGAEWRINSVWHDVSDEPELKKLLLVEDINGAYSLTYMTKIKKWKGFVQYEHYTRWAYVEDLLPNRREGRE